MGDSSMAMDMWAEYRLVKKVNQTPSASSFEFEAVKPKESAELVPPGTHIRLKLGGRLIRAYSVVGGNENKFTLGVALDRNSTRGGSLYLHDSLQKGSMITICKSAATLPLAEKADRHILIAGDIGIPGLLVSAQKLQQMKADSHLHYVIRSLDEVEFEADIKSLGSNVTIYCKNAGNPFEISDILQQADITPSFTAVLENV